MIKNVFTSLRWIFTVTKRFSRVERSSRSSVTSKLSLLGICFGVMTLIVVMSVMNGFQMSFITAIQEISSYHVRVTNLNEEKEEAFNVFCNKSPIIKNAYPFYEAQTLMTGLRGRESAAVVRAIDSDCYVFDDGFRRELKMISGSFDLEDENSIVLGSILARNLSCVVGTSVNLLVLSGGSDVDLISGERNFIVKGIFNSGYNDINSAYCFINLDAAQKYFGKNAERNWGLKLNKISEDVKAVSVLKTEFPECKISPWRDFNKSFFGTLRMEKSMLLLLVGLIFVVVGINIYNGMRRLVFQRRSEIAVFTALGATKTEVQTIFVMRGLITGILGSFIGVILGILISEHTQQVFYIVAKIMYGFQYAYTAVTAPQNLSYVKENSSYAIYADIPSIIFYKEVLLISLFGLFSPLFACWVASKNVLKMTVAEVLHNE